MTQNRPPGVYVDKQTSLVVLAPSADFGNGKNAKKSDKLQVGGGAKQTSRQRQIGQENSITNLSNLSAAATASSTASSAPGCRFRNEYCEEDVATLLSDWMEYDDYDDECDSSSISSSSLTGSDDDGKIGVHPNQDVLLAAEKAKESKQRSHPDANPNNKNNISKNGKRSSFKLEKKKSKRSILSRPKLQWRPPGMSKSNNNSIKNRLPPSTSPLSCNLTGGPPKQAILTNSNANKNSSHRTTINGSPMRLSHSPHNDNNSNNSKKNNTKRQSSKTFASTSSSGATVATLRSTASSSYQSYHTATSMATQKRSNRALNNVNTATFYKQQQSRMTGKSTISVTSFLSAKSGMAPMARMRQYDSASTGSENNDGAVVGNNHVEAPDDHLEMEENNDTDLPYQQQQPEIQDIQMFGAKLKVTTNCDSLDHNVTTNTHNHGDDSGNDDSGLYGCSRICLRDVDAPNTPSRKQIDINGSEMNPMLHSPDSIANFPEQGPTRDCTNMCGVAVSPSEAENHHIHGKPVPPPRTLSSSSSLRISPTNSSNKKGEILSTSKSGKTITTFGVYGDSDGTDNHIKSDTQEHDGEDIATYRAAMNKMRKLMTSSPTNESNQPDHVNSAEIDDRKNTSIDTSIFSGIDEKTQTNSSNKDSNKNNSKNDDSDSDDDNNPDYNERKPGPIDIDTCQRHLTPTERHHLRAMHKLGYQHLRRNDLPSALTVFTEILRGQTERHGKRSIQVAMAMHNLGVVYVKAEKYPEACRLCDGAARIRVEKLGKDHLDVAVSLAQQGVALMEMREYEVALASFREALRIRILGLGEEHPLVVRLLNNIGCALFEMDDLEESKGIFDEALRLQRLLMREQNGEVKGGRSSSGNGGNSASGVDDEDGANIVSIDPKDAHSMLLSIALTLCNLGSIHLRWGKYDESSVYYEEALLIQESVLGEDHKIVVNTKESINFVNQSKDTQPTSQEQFRFLNGDNSNIFGGIKKIYEQMQHSVVENVFSSHQDGDIHGAESKPQYICKSRDDLTVSSFVCGSNRYGTH